MAQNRALVKYVRKNRITFAGLATGKYVYTFGQHIVDAISHNVTSCYINTIVSTCQVLL